MLEKPQSKREVRVRDLARSHVEVRADEGDEFRIPEIKTNVTDSVVAPVDRYVVNGQTLVDQAAMGLTKDDQGFKQRRWIRDDEEVEDDSFVCWSNLHLIGPPGEVRLPNGHVQPLVWSEAERESAATLC